MEFLLLSFSGDVADVATEGVEARARGAPEVQVSSSDYIIQRSRAKEVNQEEYWPEFTCTKSKKKAVMFTNVISKDKGRTSPSAEKHDLHMDNRKSEEKANKGETIMIPPVKETVQYSTGLESREVETTLNVVADSPLTYTAVPQESRAVAERFSISELFAEQMNADVFDNPLKPDTQDFQTIGDQANSANIQTKPLKDTQNIQNVTVKRLREIQFSPTTFKRRTLSASTVNITEQITFSRTVSKGDEEIPMLPDKQKLTECMELPESYHIGLTAQEDAGISVEQAASPVDGQKATSLPQSLLSTLPAESIRTETNVKEECCREKVQGRRKLHYYYDVKEEIGRGSYSFVKRVVNKENGIQCAAKFVTLKRSIQAYEERGILSKLNHTKIACLLDVFETKRTLVLVLEMCSNEGLLDHMFKKNIVPEAEVRNYIQQILEGLHYLHDNNILHLDIKPANILMVHPERDDIKICDFGFAQELTRDKLQFSKYGCPEFVAPEIVSQDPISTATDIWSIGVITFLCLTGSCPFSGENDRITLLNVKDGSFSWNSHDLECTTEDAQSFVRRIIKLIPQDRPTASECLKDRWFQEKQKLQESSTINTRRLKFFLSRDKWQRSLMCYKSILVMRSIPQLLEESSESHSLGMPRHLFEQSNSSASSASSSDIEDYTQQTSTSDISQILSTQYFTDDGDHCETQGVVSFISDILDPAVSENMKHNSVLTGSIAVEKQAIYDEDGVKAQCNPPEKCEDLSLSANRTKRSLGEAATIERSDCSRTEVKATPKLTEAISTDSALTPQALKIDSLPHLNSKPPFKLLPKHSLIKSSFYGDTLANRNLPSEDAQYTSLERTRKHIMQAGYTKEGISELCQPLLDCLQMTPQEKAVNDKRFEETSSHISQRLCKSASCDIEDKVAYGPKKNLRKTKSLDEIETKAVVQTVKGSASELIHPCFQHSDPYSNAKAIGKPVITLSTSVSEQVTDWQKTTLRDTVCSSEGVTCFTDVLQCPTKNAHTETRQSLHTNVPLESLEKEQSMELEKKDNKEYNSEMNSTVVTSFQHSIDLQNKNRESSQSFEDAESSSYFRLSEMESNSKKNQNDQKPINSHSNISEIRSFDIKGCTDSELQYGVSSFTASVVTCEPQTQSSSENVCIDAMKPDTDYFDLSEPYSYELHDDPGPSVLTPEFKDKSTSQIKSLPEQCTSKERIALRKTDANKSNALRRKSDRRSTTSYELLCNEIEPVSEYLLDVTGTEWESELLELLNGSDEDEIMSHVEEGTSKGTRKPKRTSLESKLYQSFESLRKAFKSEKEGRAPISSSEMSLIVGEGYDESSLKSTSKTSGRSGLFRLFSRSASVYWDKGFHDGDEERSRTSLSAFLERGKSQTLPARFSWQSLKSKDSAQKLELRREKQQLSPSRMESAGGQYMEVMKAPLIPSLTTHNKEKQQVDVSTDISDNATGSLKIKSKLFSFKLPVSKSKEKAPLFLEELQNQSVVLSQCVTLTCRASGYPNPKIFWFKDNQVMHRSDQILLSTTSSKCQLLTILNVAEEHLGRYKCVAENRLGKASTCCLLNLAVLPCCPDSPEVPQVFEDGALVIWNPLVSSMPITYIVQCQKKDEDWKTIASDLSESCFYASNVHKGEAYLYRVAYVNKAGKGPFSHPSVKVIIGETEVQSHSVHGEKPTSMKQTYTFLAERNRGRFSIIKKCIENSTGKSFAAKLTPYKKGRKPFVLKEYETLKKLHHNNIVQTHCAYITPRYLVMIQELCEGKELLHYLAERQVDLTWNVQCARVISCQPGQGSSYGEHHVVELLTQMLSAVEYLHFNHILHLDLRSENMIIVEHNILKLLDFGNAEIYVPGRPVLVKRCRDFVENMAPEILEGKPVVPETDIWAVGVVAFTMMSGDCPFKSDKDCDKEKNIRKGKIKLGRCYPDLSQLAVSFLRSTLCFNPGGRLCASECRSFPWFQEDTRMKLRNSGVSFQTAKLRNYLKQRENQRTLLCTKHEVLLLH